MNSLLRIASFIPGDFIKIVFLSVKYFFEMPLKGIPETNFTFIG